jgi:hypothetical protein
LESFTSGMAFLGLSFRLPIVGTRATAFKEMTDLNLCLPCDPDSPRKLAETIKTVCSWDRTAFEARCESFLAGCGWDEITERHLAAYGFDRSASKSLSSVEAARGSSAHSERDSQVLIGDCKHSTTEG